MARSRLELRTGLRLETVFDLRAVTRRTSGLGFPSAPRREPLLDRAQRAARVAPDGHVGAVVIRELGRVDIDADQQPAQGQFHQVEKIGLGDFRAHRQHDVGVGDQRLDGAVWKRRTKIRRMAFGKDSLARRSGDAWAIQRVDETVKLGAGMPRAAAGDDDGPSRHGEQPDSRLDLLVGGLGQGYRLGKARCRQRGHFAQHVQGNFEISGPRPAGAQRRQTRPEMIAHVLGARRGASHAENAGGQRPLVLQFVQHTPLLAQRRPYGRTCHHQKRHRVGVRLRDRGQDVREAGT